MLCITVEATDITDREKFLFDLNGYVVFRVAMQTNEKEP